MASRAQSRTTTDHEEIRRWAEERNARPSCVRGTGGGEDIGMIRLDFPGFSGGQSLEEISWDDWFDKFDESGLALLFQETTANGQKSNFNKLISREAAEGGTPRRQAKRAQAAGSRGRTRSARTASSRGTSSRGRKRRTTAASRLTGTRRRATAGTTRTTRAKRTNAVSGRAAGRKSETARGRRAGATSARKTTRGRASTTSARATTGTRRNARSTSVSRGATSVGARGRGTSARGKSTQARGSKRTGKVVTMQNRRGGNNRGRGRRAA